MKLGADLGRGCGLRFQVGVLSCIITCEPSHVGTEYAAIAVTVIQAVETGIITYLCVEPRNLANESTLFLIFGNISVSTQAPLADQ